MYRTCPLGWTCIVFRIQRLDGVPVVAGEAQPVNVGPTRTPTNMVAERGHIDIPAPEAPDLDRAPQAHPGNPFADVDIKWMLREVIQEELRGIYRCVQFSW